MKRANLISAVTMCAVVTLFTYGCADPDPGGAFDQYTEIVGEESLGTAGLCDADDRDLSGFYFVRLQHDIGPSDHILMSFDVSQSGGKYNLVVQPLKTDVTNERINKLDENGDPICRVDKDGNIIYESNDPEQCKYEKIDAPREDARTPVGDPITLSGLEMDENGELHIELDQLRVDGQANSFTWGDILADISLTVVGCADDDQLICGVGNLDVFEPTNFPGRKGNFGGVLVDEITTDSKAPLSCDADPE